jgi:uncharacterized protein YydD (DUF2326 family)
MIHEVTSSLPTFRTVLFKPGFNIVLADKTKASTKDDSRNGVGKSTLVEIIQFCLGADVQKGDTLAHEGLKGFSFDLVFDLRGERVRVSRNTSAKAHVTLAAKSFDNWPYKPTKTPDGYRLKTTEWNAVLGSRLFNAPTDSTRKYKPTFRSLISYFARRGNVRRFERGKSTLKIELERLQQRAREDYDRRRDERAKAVQTFGQYSRALYKDEAGHLVIDINDSGFTFAIEKMRTRSTGIISMKIFCYDLTLASIHSDDAARPGFLIHDSQLFADVDGRQVATALFLAHREAQVKDFQYICMFNSDKLPTSELSPELNIDALTAIRLTDKDAAGSLLGMRF